MSNKTPVKMTANFFQVKVSLNLIFDIHAESSSIMLRLIEDQGLIQDLV